MTAADRRLIDGMTRSLLDDGEDDLPRMPVCRLIAHAVRAKLPREVRQRVTFYSLVEQVSEALDVRLQATIKEAR